MTTFFTKARFCRLLVAHWAESWNKYAWFVGVAIIVDLVFLVILFGTVSRTFEMFQFSGQVAWYTAGLFVTGIIFAGLYFKDLVNPGSALITLMRPGSQFEKLLLTILVVSILFPLVYTLFYCLIHYPVVQLAEHFYLAPQRCNDCAKEVPDFRFFIPFFTMEAQKNIDGGMWAFFRVQVFVLLMFWTFQALLLNGAVFFKKSPVLRTILTLFLIWIISLNIVPELPIKSVWVNNVEDRALYSFFETILPFLHWAGFLLLLWGALFFNFKEREVV